MHTQRSQSGYREQTTNLLTGILATLLLIGAPLVGVLIQDGQPARYLEFPPLTQETTHPGFNTTAFFIITLINLLMVILMVKAIGSFRWHTGTRPVSKRYPWPIWGWVGIGLVGLAWIAAWNRFAWMEPLQHHTFVPLWLGYIVTINALAQKQSGACLLTRRPLAMTGLTVLSAFFWWFFEYLNRFVQNWHYLEVQDFGRRQYIVFASLSFATVLPAVISTLYWLMTLPPFGQPLALKNKTAPARWWPGRCLAATGLMLSTAILILLVIRPAYLFPFVWGAPAVVLVCLQTLFSPSRTWKRLMGNDLRPWVLAPLAALICGFFWEMWNYHSLAKWEYTIPFVDRWHLFEMPLHGYGGYLPFGWECWIVSVVFFKKSFGATQ